MNIANCYAATEEGPLIGHPEGLDIPPDTVGVPLPSVEYKMVEVEGSDFPEFAVLQTGVSASYIMPDGKEDKTIYEIGGHKYRNLRDTITIDEKGVVNSLERTDGLIKRFAIQIFPSEVKEIIDEAISKSDLGCQINCALGVKNDDRGAVVLSYIEIPENRLYSPEKTKELIDAINEAISNAGYLKRPDYVIIAPVKFTREENKSFPKRIGGALESQLFSRININEHIGSIIILPSMEKQLEQNPQQDGAHAVNNIEISKVEVIPMNDSAKIKIDNSRKSSLMITSDANEYKRILEKNGLDAAEEYRLNSIGRQLADYVNNIPLFKNGGDKKGRDIREIEHNRVRALNEENHVIIAEAVGDGLLKHYQELEGASSVKDVIDWVNEIKVKSESRLAEMRDEKIDDKYKAEKHEKQLNSLASDIDVLERFLDKNKTSNDSLNFESLLDKEVDALRFKTVIGRQKMEEELGILADPEALEDAMFLERKRFYYGRNLMVEDPFAFDRTVSENRIERMQQIQKEVGNTVLSHYAGLAEPDQIAGARSVLEGVLEFRKAQDVEGLSKRMQDRHMEVITVLEGALNAQDKIVLDEDSKSKLASVIGEYEFKKSENFGNIKNEVEIAKSIDSILDNIEEKYRSRDSINSSALLSYDKSTEQVVIPRIVRVELNKSFSFQKEDGSEGVHRFSSLRTFKNRGEDNRLYVSRFGVMDIPIEDELTLEDGTKIALNYTLRHNLTTQDPKVTHAMQESGVYNGVMHRQGALWTLATHDDQHGKAIPFPDPVPEAFKQWQQELLTGPQAASGVSRAPNYEHGSFNLHYRRAQRVYNTDKVLRTTENALKVLDSLQEQGSEGVDMKAVKKRIASDILRATSHIVPYENEKFINLHAEYGISINKLMKVGQEVDEFELGQYKEGDKVTAQKVFLSDKERVQDEQNSRGGKAKWEEMTYRFMGAMKEHHRTSPNKLLLEKLRAKDWKDRAKTDENNEIDRVK